MKKEEKEKEIIRIAISKERKEGEEKYLTPPFSIFIFSFYLFHIFNSFSLLFASF
jgi:hypothetical protein